MSLEQEKQPPIITLRKVTVADLEQYIELEKTRSGLKTYSSMTNEFDALEQIEKSTNYFIQNDREEIVGTVSYRVRLENKVEIDGVLIKPEAEGKGYARAALQKLIGELAPYPNVYLMTHPDNPRSIPLYASVGFVVTGRVEDYFGDGEPRIKMELVRN